MEAVKRLLSTSSVNINSRADVSQHCTHCVVWLDAESRELRTLESHRGVSYRCQSMGFVQCCILNLARLLTRIHE